MPVEIRELHITTIVQETGTQVKEASSQHAAPSGHTAIVAECVEQVLEILKQKTER